MAEASQRGLELARELSGQVMELVVEQGKEANERKASFAHGGRRGDSFLVFLPTEAPVGKRVRAKITTVSYDKRGLPLFRGQPDDDKIVEHWHQNSDGTLSFVQHALNWLLEEKEIKVLESRPAISREKNPIPECEYTLSWGADLSSTFVVRVTKNVYPVETEFVQSDGELGWQKTGEREEVLAPEELSATKVVIYEDRFHNSVEWLNKRFDKTYQLEMKLSVGVTYTDETHRFETTWGELPGWYQQELEGKYPLCACGRARRDPNVADGYDRCETCRKEQKCARCGKDKPVNLVNGRLICRECQPMEKMEQLVRQMLSTDSLQKIADEAGMLLAANRVFDRDSGLLVLEVGLTDNPDKTRILEGWKKHQTFYFLDDGIYGSQFNDAALTLVSLLPRFQGNQLVTMIAWLVITGTIRGRFGGAGQPSYYERTVLNGETVEPSFGEDELKKLVEKLESQKPVLAGRIRGSEKDRQEVVRLTSGIKTALEELKNLGKGHRELVQNALSEVHAIIEAPEQDYAKALEPARKAHSLLPLLQKINAAIAKDLMICPICGQPFDDDRECRGHHDYEILDLVRWIETGELGQEEKEVTPLVRLSNERGQVVAEVRIHPVSRQRNYGETYLVTFPIDEYERHNDPHDALAWDGSPFERLEAKIVRMRSAPENHRIREIRSDIAELDREIEHLQHATESEREDYEKIEQRFLERPSGYSSAPVESGTVFSTSFVLNDERNQWETGPFFDIPSGSWVKLIVGQWENGQPEASKEVLVWVKPKNSEQLSLFSYRDDNPEGPFGRGGRKVTVYGYLVEVVSASEDIEGQITRLEQEKEVLKVELLKLESNDRDLARDFVEEAFDESGDPTTSMGAAFKEAGLLDEDNEL